jgi:hypothetical protein
VVAGAAPRPPSGHRRLGRVDRRRRSSPPGPPGRAADVRHLDVSVPADDPALQRRRPRALRPSARGRRLHAGAGWRPPRVLSRPYGIAAAMASALATVTLPLALDHRREPLPAVQWVRYLAHLQPAERAAVVVTDDVPLVSLVLEEYAPAYRHALVSRPEMPALVAAYEAEGRRVYSTSPDPSAPQEWTPLACFARNPSFSREGRGSSAVRAPAVCLRARRPVCRGIPPDAGSSPAATHRSLGDWTGGLDEGQRPRPRPPVLPLRPCFRLRLRDRCTNAMGNRSQTRRRPPDVVTTPPARPCPRRGGGNTAAPASTGALKAACPRWVLLSFGPARFPARGDDLLPSRSIPLAGEWYSPTRPVSVQEVLFA